MRIFLIVISLLFLTKVSFSQESNKKNAKNSISLNEANILITGNYSVNYERNVYEGKRFKYLINVGYGGWYTLSNSLIIASSSIPISMNCLTGIGNNHFEINVGMQILPNKTWKRINDNGVDQDGDPYYNKAKASPIFNLGYRYQRIQGGLIFRSFIGVGGVGIALGYAF